MFDWTRCTALRCLADLPPGLCLPEDLAGQRETAMLLLSGRPTTHVLSFSPKLGLDVRGLQDYLCPKKEFVHRDGSSGCDAAETPWMPGLRLTELGWLAS